jgi:hypothetical protein
MSEMWVSDPGLPDSPDEILLDRIKFYPDLVSTNILVLFKEKAKVDDGRPILGKVSKANPTLQAVYRNFSKGEDPDPEFVITLGWDAWNLADHATRSAWIDFILAQCFAEENEKDGSMKYKVRAPSIMAFPEIIARHGTDWDSGLSKLKVLSMSNDGGSDPSNLEIELNDED